MGRGRRLRRGGAGQERGFAEVAGRARVRDAEPGPSRSEGVVPSCAAREGAVHAGKPQRGSGGVYTDATPTVIPPQT